MRRHLSSTFLAAAIAATLTSLALAQTTPTPAPAAETRKDLTDVPVRRVVLFSSGVGFFQHAGKVSGNAAAELRFKTDQINDILKSLVVSDASAGNVKSITYGSQNPISRTLKSFQIDISTNPTLAGILNQVRGSRVTLTLGDEKVEGTILGVEEKDRPVGKPDESKTIKTSYVNLITSTGIRSLPLDDVKRLELNDPDLQKELDQALAALAQARDKDKKPVIVNFEGTGDRSVSIAYLVETPVWKTSYRLILPDPTSTDTATLLGWAIVENQTDNDWNNVTLDLIGGRPISFIQDLYQPLYVPRPRVQTKTYASLVPQTYDEGLESARERIALQQSAAAAQAPANAPAGIGRGGRGGGGGGGFGGGAAPAPARAASDALQAEQAQRQLADMPTDFSQGVRSLADGGKVGEMFQYSVAGVSLPRQRSSMIPIISDHLPFDRLSIYNQSVLPRNPLLGVRLKNQSKNYLLAGPVSVLDKIKKPDNSTADSYAGDATVDDVPPGQERLLSYAVDQELLIDATKRDTNVRLMTGSIVQGVLQLKWTDAVTQQYLVDNKADHDKMLLIEHPVQSGYDLKEPAKSLEKTDKVYRFQMPLPAKKNGEFRVREERVRGESLAILGMDFPTIDFYTTNGAIPQKVKDALNKAAEKRRTIADLDRRMAAKDQERTRILQDQANIRENIRVLPANAKTRDDAINDLATKDASLKAVTKDIDTLRDNLESARTDLNNYLNNLTIE